jgi:hypothetical protein
LEVVMASVIQRERLRGDLDVDEVALSDAEIDDAFARAAERYGDNTGAVEASARVVAIQQLLGGAAKRADTSQNESSQRHSQVFEHLMRLRAIYLADLQEALNAVAQFGGLHRKPTRIEEYPDA